VLTVLSFIFVLGILVFIHELGHFLVAKRVGIKVHRFALGFPPYIFTKTVGETAYSIGIIPGGVCQNGGENPDDPSTGDPANSKSSRRTAVISPAVMNYVLSIVLLIGVLYFGGQPI
jgi:regulator of sigma E protease